jgi:hypothetical protein
MNAISFIKVSELLFEIFMFVFVMLFFLTFARISSGVFTEDSMWGIYGYGLTAALLASIVTIPRIVIALVGLDAVAGNEFNFAHLTTFVFIIAYIFASLGIGFKDGLKNRRQVSEIDLPDDEIIVKKDDFNEYFEAEEEEIAEEVIAPLESFEESFETVEFVVEEPAEEVVEETVEVAVEEPAEEVVEETVEEAVEEAVEEVVEETVEFVLEETVEEAAEEAPKETVFETLEYTQAKPEPKEKKKSKLFKKTGKTKQAPSRKDAGDSELTAVSLADLKNKNKD